MLINGFVESIIFADDELVADDYARDDFLCLINPRESLMADGVGRGSFSVIAMADELFQSRKVS